MKAYILLMFAIGMVNAPILHSQEAVEPTANSPGKLVKLRDSWLAARKRALDPIDQKYEQMLKKMIVGYTRAGDLDSALAVKSELDKLTKEDQPVAAEKPAASLTIVKAVYGSDKQVQSDSADDVTATVREQIREGKISVNVHRDIFGDPNPYGPKTLVVEYKKKGSKKIWKKEVSANQILKIP